MGYHYELSGVHIESDLRLASLPGYDGGSRPQPPGYDGGSRPHTPGASEASTPKLTIRLVEEPSPSPAGDPLLSRSSDGVPWLSVFRWNGGYLFKVHDITDFALDARSAEITCVPLFGVEPTVLSQLFIDQIFPLILHVSGRFSFHASSVALGGFGVIAFLGMGGRGKSTLAASLASTSAFTFFSDDCLALTPTTAGVLVHPSYPSSRLWPPSAEALFREQGELPCVSPRTDKRRLALPTERAPQPLRRVYLLEEGEGDPTIEPLRRRDALAALAAHVYRLDYQDRARLAEEISILERVVTSAAVKRLTYRRSYAALSAVHAMIRADTSVELK